MQRIAEATVKLAAIDAVGCFLCASASLRQSGHRTGQISGSTLIPAAADDAPFEAREEFFQIGDSHFFEGQV